MKYNKLKPICSRCRMAIDYNQVMVLVDGKIMLFLHPTCMVPKDPKECRCGAPAKVNINQCGECKVALIESSKEVLLGQS